MRWPTLLVALSALALASVPSPAALSVQFDPKSGEFSRADDEYGELLAHASLHAIIGGSEPETTRRAFREERTRTSEGTRLTVSSGSPGKRLIMRFDTLSAGRTLEIRGDWEGGPAEVALEGAFIRLGSDPIIGLLKDQAPRELRLRIPKATVTPTTNELEVYRFARE